MGKVWLRSVWTWLLKPRHMMMVDAMATRTMASKPPISIVPHFASLSFLLEISIYAWSFLAVDSGLIVSPFLLPNDPSPYVRVANVEEALLYLPLASQLAYSAHYWFNGIVLEDIMASTGKYQISLSRESPWHRECKQGQCLGLSTRRASLKHVSIQDQVPE